METNSYAVVIEQEGKSYGAHVPDLPGCAAVGRTLEEVQQLIEEAIAAHAALLREREVTRRTRR